MLEFQRFHTYLSAEKRYSPHTTAAYLSDHAQFTAYLEDTYGITRVQDVEHTAVRSWVVSLLEGGLSPRSIQRKVSAIRTFFKLMVRDGILEHAPTRQVVTPKRGERVPSFLSEADMETLLDPERFTDDFSGQRDRLLLTLLYETGMRRAELIGLHISDVHRDRMELRVLGKRSKERRVPISHAMLKQIDVYTAYKDENFGSTTAPELMLTNTGKKLYPKFVYNVVNRYLLGVTTVGQKSPHVLRHTFATHMLNHGADLNAIKEILGHASLAATQVYTHNSIAQLKAIHQQAHPKG